MTTDHTGNPPTESRTDRVNQARRMRAVDGLSKRQIADHFGVSPSLLTKWLRGIEPPEWTRRPNAKDGLRERARELRRTGSSVPEIAEELGVSRPCLEVVATR